MSRPSGAPDLFAAARAAARTRTPMEDGPDHLCRVCGEPAGFGFGVFLRRGIEGRWSCMAHRAEVEAMPE